MFMLPPTYLTCLEVAQHAEPGAVLDASAERSVDMFTPEVVGSGDEATLSIPSSLHALVEARLSWLS